MVFTSNGNWNATANTPALPVVKSVSTAMGQIGVVAVSGTFTRATGSFVADGFVPNQKIDTSGFTNAGNNTTGTKIIATVDAGGTFITVTNVTGLVDETGNGDELILDSNYLHYYIVSETDGIAHSYANGELERTYAVNDAVVATQGSNKWIKISQLTYSFKELGQGNVIDSSGRTMLEIVSPNIINPRLDVQPPIITPSLRAGGTVVAGTADPSMFSVRVTIGASDYAGTVTAGAWSVAVPLLFSGDVVAVRARLEYGAESQPTIMVVAAADGLFPPGADWAYGNKPL